VFSSVSSWFRVEQWAGARYLCVLDLSKTCNACETCTEMAVTGRPGIPGCKQCNNVSRNRKRAGIDSEVIELA
jgi:hypothetical protein